MEKPLNREGKCLSSSHSARLDSRSGYSRYGALAEDHGCTLKSGLPRKNGLRSQDTSGYRKENGLRSQPPSGSQKFNSATTSRPSPQGKTRARMRPSNKEGVKEKGRIVAVQRSTSSQDKRTYSDAIEFSDSESEDEMDLLSSQADCVDDPSSSQDPVLCNRLASTKHFTKDDAKFKGSPHQRDIHVDSNGREHHYHPNFHPSNVFSHLTFKKNKSDSRVKETTANFKPSSSLPPSRLDLSEDNYGDSFLGPKRPHEAKAKDKSDIRNIDSLKNVNSSRRDSPPRHNTQRTGPQLLRLANQPKVDTNNKPRPRPRHVSKIQTGQKSRKSRSPSKSRNGRSSPVATSQKITPAAFPVISPPSSPAVPSKMKTADFPPISPLRDLNPEANHEPKRPKQLGSCSRLHNPFPMISPPPKRREEGEEVRGRTRVKRMKGKGMLKENDDVALFSRSEEEHDENGPSFFTSKKGKNKGKDKGKEKEGVFTTENESKRHQRQKSKKFPMSTQMLESIDSSPPSWQGKRSSEGGSEDERITKKSKRELDTFIESPSHAFEEFDSIMISPDVDPQSLCPYCDTPLPANPSVHLLNLLVSTRKKSKPDPRPSNPLGLKAPMSVFVTACQRHRFESQILPEAERKGWPQSFDWKAVAKRVVNMKAALKELVDDPGDMVKGEREEDAWEVPYGKGKRKNGPKADSIFWNEVMDEVKRKGSRALAGVRGQFENFEKAQPGYYGEQGSVIIHQTLYDMFPPNSMNSSSIAPLTGSEFMEKILVPEVALRLIMEDKRLEGEKGMRDALTTLRESSAYGVFMFPEDGGDSSGAKKSNRDRLGVGDMIVMERAMKRRKELEEEEKWEAEERAMVAVSRGGANEKQAAPPKPIPRPIAQDSSIFSSQEEPRRSQTRRNRIRSVHSDTNPASGFETAINASESDSDGFHKAVRQDRRQSSVETVKRTTRSTSRGLARLNLCSDSDPGLKNSVETRRTTCSRSRSVLLLQDAFTEGKMEAVRVSEGSDVEVLDTPISKTPVVIRGVTDVDNDKTPMAAKHARTPPLLRAKQRRNGLITRQIQGNSKTSLKTRMGHSSEAQFPPNDGPSPQQDDFEWLLKDYSSSSQ